MMDCCICKKTIPVVGDWHTGNDAWPVADGRCCNDCDMAIVLPARLARVMNDAWPVADLQE